MQTVLLVEDHACTRVWLRDLLTEAFINIQAYEVENCRQAIKALDAQRFNLALLDINLPDGSGISLTETIKNRFPETYCVITTILDDDKHLFAALKAGAQGYLLKEQSRAQLISQLRGIISGEPPLSPAIARRVLRFFCGNAECQKCSNLSKREIEVLTLIAKGLSRSEIARMLGISSNTAAGHVKSIYIKLNVSSRAEATLQAARFGLVNAAD